MIGVKCECGVTVYTPQRCPNDNCDKLLELPRSELIKLIKSAGGYKRSLAEGHGDYRDSWVLPVLEDQS